MKGSRGTFGHPVGAVSLAAAGVSPFLKYLTVLQVEIALAYWTSSHVERAFSAFQTGSKVADVPAFSREKCGNQVRDYVVDVKQLSEKAWKRIGKACGLWEVKKKKDVRPVAGLSLEKKCGNLFVPSSPVGSDYESEADDE